MFLSSKTIPKIKSCKTGIDSGISLERKHLPSYNEENTVCENEPRHDKTNKVTCAPDKDSLDSDQPDQSRRCALKG